VRDYVSAHNRKYPTKYAKFGNSPLVSLDEVLFEDGTATRGDTITGGLWDLNAPVSPGDRIDNATRF
jgi:hypothetical protein